MNRKVAIICDFDGTVSSRDVGHNFFSLYVPDGERRRELLDSWKVGLISSRECLEGEFALMDANRTDLDTFIEGESLDPYFKDFVDFCNRRKYEFLILSDGLDYYIDRILMKFGLGFLDFRANHLVVNSDSIAGIEFPYYNLMECTMCGNCKRYHVEQLAGRGYFSVYVGNGYSDRCPSEYADLVFAKGDLLVHCRQENIPCIPFDNFRDVEREVTSRLILS